MRLLIGLLLCVCMTAIGADPIRVEIVSGEVSAATCRGTIDGRSWAAGETLTLDGELPLHVTLASTDCWAPPLLIEKGEDSSVHVWRKRTLHGRLDMARGDPQPTTLTARIASPPKTAVAVPPTDVDCNVKNGVVTCDAPAVPLDIRIAAEGFAPVYLWDVTGTTLGELRLSRGTVVTGYARPARGTLSTIAVELRPSSLAWSPEDHQRLNTRTRTAKANARGFFQFMDVEAGEYVAQARHDGWSPAQQRVIVRAGREEESVTQELVLAELGRIEVDIRPPVDPQQKPWRVKLHRMLGGDMQDVTQSAASLTGQWQHEGLEHGAYALEVRDSDGKVVSREGVGVWGGRELVPITIDQVVVRGTLSMDDDPVEARLEFFDINGRRLWMASDEEGRFSGMLPEQGIWNVNVVREGKGRIEIPKIDVRRPDAKDYAELELELPAGRVHGVVVDATGQAVDARVRVWRNRRVEGSGRFTDGSFDFSGLTKGEVELWADAREGESGLIPHTIGGAEDEPVEIVVAKRRTVRGVVLSPEGLPIAGAQIVWMDPYYIESVVTGPRGQFKIDLGPSDTHIDVGVVAIGYPLKVLRLDARSEETQRVRLTAVAGQMFLPMITGRDGPFPYIIAPGLRALPLGAMRGDTLPPPPGLPVRIVRGGYLVDAEPGAYSICANIRLEHCHSLTLHAGARETIDTSKWTP